MSPAQLWTLTYYAGYLTNTVNGPAGLVFRRTLTWIQLLDSTVHDAGGDADSDADVDADGDTPSNYPRDTDGTRIPVRIPNFEIRRKFRQWLRNYIDQCMEPEIKSKSISLFRKMVSGDISSFAAQFGKLVWDTMPIQFLGRKEAVYQAYVSAYFTAACDASTALDRRNKSAWDIRVEEYGGIGCMDLILQRIGDDTGVLHEHNRVPLKDQDKKGGYGDSQRQRLTKKAEEALVQLETRQYRASMKDHVTKLHEYGLAFLGPYCAVVGRSLERKQEGPWKTKNTYGFVEDEERRKLLYTSQTS